MINIIDGFYLGKSTPIDSRIVASGSVARNAIAYKYEGLRVYDTSDLTPYVWMNNSWEYENQNGVATSNTTASYVPLLTSTNVIGNSVIYQSSGKIGINTTSPAHALDVSGYIRAGSGFIGDGSNVINMNVASASGKLPLANLTNATVNGHILVGGSPNPIYTNPSNFTIGRSDNAKINNAADNTDYNLIFATGSNTYAPLKSSSSKITFNPSTGKLFLKSSGNAASPVLAIGALNTGLYRYSTNGIGISTDGVLSAKFISGGTSLLNPSVINVDDFLAPIGTSIGWPTYSTITSVNYDRVIYLLCDIFSALTLKELTAGRFGLAIILAADGSSGNYIYQNVSSFDSGSYSWGHNFSFLLPSNCNAQIIGNSINVAWNPSPPTFYIRSTKFGL